MFPLETHGYLLFVCPYLRKVLPQKTLFFPPISPSYSSPSPSHRLTPSAPPRLLSRDLRWRFYNLICREKTSAFFIIYCVPSCMYRYICKSLDFVLVWVWILKEELVNCLETMHSLYILNFSPKELVFPNVRKKFCIKTKLFVYSKYFFTFYSVDPKSLFLENWIFLTF